MKRLVTILLSSIMCVCLWGQAPMVVVGDMYIDVEGRVNSLGTVHLKALNKKNAARVDNHGKLAMDTIILYANDSIDGLLRNNISTAEGVVVKKAAIVRKNFSKDQYWYLASIPFNVDMDATSTLTNKAVRDVLTGQFLQKGKEYNVQYHDAQIMADYGGLTENPDTNEEYPSPWQILSTDTIKRGTGYRMAVLFNKFSSPTPSTGRDIDFITTSSSDISHLFARQLKGVDLTHATRDSAKIKNGEIPLLKADKGTGWNLIGGLHACNFVLSTEPANPTTYFEGHVYYPYDKTAKGVDGWMLVSLKYNQVLTATPYSTFFVRTTPEMAEAVSGSKSLRFSDGGGFGYYSGGPSLGGTGISFRSSAAPSSEDAMEVTLSDPKTNFSYPLNFRFREDYSKAYKMAEDPICLGTRSSVNPVLWALAYPEDDPDAKYEVSLNALPYGENEVSLGVNVPAAGEYVFSLTEFVNETIGNAVLWDKETGRKTDLLTNDYRFQVDGAINTEERFVLHFNDSGFTGIDNTPSSVTEVYAYAENNVLTVKNLLEGDKVQVMDLTGRTIASGIASGKEFSVKLNQKGIYVVGVKGGKALKVLNK